MAWNHHTIISFLAYLHYFEKIKVGLWDRLAVCAFACVCVCPPEQRLNAWTNLYKTWYVYHDTWSHLNGLRHKSLPSVCGSVWISLLDNGSVNTFPRQRIRAKIEQLLDASFPMRSVSYQTRVCGSACISRRHVALHASHAALPMVTPKFRPAVALQMLNQNFTNAALPMWYKNEFRWYAVKPRLNLFPSSFIPFRFLNIHPLSLEVRFVADEMALRQVFLQASSVPSCQPLFHHSSIHIYHWLLRCAIALTR
jgi:hypothetical protein